MTHPVRPIVAIVGPTASGKTALAVELAQRLGGEVINADSRQVYRHMDIGTAKPTPAERRSAPHHLLNLVNPDEVFSLGVFLSLAHAAADDIASRDRRPLLVGGSGQYVWAMLEGWDVPAIPPDQRFRRAMEELAAEKGPEELHRRLAALDPPRATALDPRNVRRVIRALEIYDSIGVEPSRLGQRAPCPPPSVVIGLTADRQTLYRRIDRRVDAMMDGGFLEEVSALAGMGYPMSESALNCPGYRELGEHLLDACSLDDAVQRTKFRTHRMARRQYTWFKPSDHRIYWLDTENAGLVDAAWRIVEDAQRGQSPVVQ